MDNFLNKGSVLSLPVNFPDTVTPVLSKSSDFAVMDAFLWN